jgi:hypothetical protein
VTSVDPAAADLPPAPRRRAFSIFPSGLLCLCFLLPIGLSACSSYDPPVQGDHATDKYKDDLEKCRTASREAVRIRNADTPWTWILSPFTGPPQVRAAIRSCMQGKGYVLANQSH